jgi:hypothetical protein
VERGRDPAAIQEQDRLASVLGEPPELRQQRRRERVARLAAQVDDAHRREPAAQPLAELEAFEALPALRPRRGAAVERHRALERCPLGRHRAGVVAWVGLLLVGGVVLLVDADQADSAHRREHGRACADDDARRPARDPLPFVPPLRLREARVQDRDGVPEARPEASDRLRRERDLGHEHDRPEAPLERRRGGLEVDLRLAAARGAVEEEVVAAGVDRVDDPRHRLLLGSAQPLWGRLAVERLPLARGRLLLPPRPPHRRDELQRPRRGRAVVLGQPEREIDERLGQLVDDALDRHRAHPDRRRFHDLDHDPPRARAAERHRHDSALARAVGELVGELAPTEGARGDERDYGAETHIGDVSVGGGVRRRRRRARSPSRIRA